MDARPAERADQVGNVWLHPATDAATIAELMSRALYPGRLPITLRLSRKLSLTQQGKLPAEDKASNSWLCSQY